MYLSAGNDDAPCDNLHVRGRGIMDLEFEGDGKEVFRYSAILWRIILKLVAKQKLVKCEERRPETNKI